MRDMKIKSCRTSPRWAGPVAGVTLLATAVLFVPSALAGPLDSVLSDPVLQEDPQLLDDRTLSEIRGRGMEGIDQLVGNMTNKTDGIAQDNLHAGIQLHPPQGRIQRGKQFVRRVHRLTGQVIEQGGFAGIGIADQGDDGGTATLAQAPALLSLSSDFLQTSIDGLDTLADQAAVRFQLGFTGTP